MHSNMYLLPPKERDVDQTNLSLCEVILKKHLYLYCLISISILIFLLSPHTVIYQEMDDQFIENNRDLSDFNVDFPILIQLERSNDTLQTINISTQEQPKKSKRPTENLSESKHTHSDAQCNAFKDSEKFDCFPQENANEELCKSRGCCWSPVNSTSKEEQGVPYCYYPSKFRSYRYVNIYPTDLGATAYLANVVNSTYPDNIQMVRIDFNYLDENILQVKIYDANQTRFESPLPKLSLTGRRLAKNTSYYVNIDKDKLGFNVIRKSTNQSLFNAEDMGGFIFANQLLQLSAQLPTHRIYGLGQQRNEFLLDTNWRVITLFNRDQEPIDKSNLYGTHPFYLAVEDGGLAHGVFLLNTNAMDIILQPAPAITYRTIGGVLDFFFFLGPTPADVISQYTGLIGRPFMPPYWSLGFHLCRFGYKSLSETMEVWNRTRNAGIPLDTQWNDIDYMVRRNDFTYDPVAYKGLPQFVDLLHKEGMHYMIITDPGVSAGEPSGTYPPYDEGLKDGVFIMDPSEDKPFITKVWNDKATVFPDFFNPKTDAYWTRQIKQLHDKFAFDGLWIDMNEPSTEWNGGKDGCLANPLDNPPYLPRVQGGQLYSRTVCMSARHYGAKHYDVHNIFATQESILTVRALKTVRKKRAFVISRASYPSQGHFTGVWTGDISSTWDDMAHSIPDILSFSLFGIPMSGADICGFNQNTTVALCKAWSQLGAFYPFSRNHNSIENFDQDPVALGPEVVDAAKKALLTRYFFLPYLYTLFWHAHNEGETVARPMLVEFPKDEKTYNLHSQFLWGSGLLIAPMLSEEKGYATAYLPAGRWYNFYSFKQIVSKGSTYLLDTPSDSLPLLLRGGRIIPGQKPNTTTTTSRLNPMALLVSLCDHNMAHGDLYWDDGDSYDFETGTYNFLTFKATGLNVSSTVEHWSYKTRLVLGEVDVLGVPIDVSKVIVNSKPANFTFDKVIKFLLIQDLSLDMSQPFTISWS
ncbi:lysosomal alpha-glucosidase-like [Macrosteles quadrilineatus]|uniref:lysosomal alpha-glucosidase-like n=1 Tax=Macrosteles quadrilineatus TaxID=74068 RepID=UPI0023E33EC2|nr:lysosomal alpha-glucosidase-like [Macrosteles quadrilineatus]